MSLELDGGGRKRKTRPASRVSLPPDGVCELSKVGDPRRPQKEPVCDGRIVSTPKPQHFRL